MLNLAIIILIVCVIEIAAGIWLIRSTARMNKQFTDQWPQAGKISKEADYKLKLSKDQRI